MLNLYEVNKIMEVSLPCGSGKTMSTCDYIARNEEKKFVVVCPTKELSRQWAEQLRLRHVRYLDKVDSNECQENVGLAIEQALLGHNAGFSDDGHRVIIITQASLKTANIMHLVSDWTLIIDEIMGIENFRQYSLTRHYDNLIEYLNIDETFDHSTLYKLKIINKTFRTSEDSFLNVIKPLLQDMDGYYEAFVEKKNWNEIIKDRIVSEDKEKNILSVLALITPKIFESFKEVITLGANLQNSMLRRWFELHHGIPFRPFLEIIRNKEYQHTNGHRLTIHYLMEGNYSKYARNKEDDEHGTLGKRLLKMAEELLDDGYLYVQNNDVKDTNHKGKRISVMSMGSNEYSDSNQMYYTTALNRKPENIRILNALGYTNDAIKAATVIESCYQSIMRTSLRNPEATEPVTLVVNDLFTANAVARLFPECSVVPHKDFISKKEALTQDERNARRASNKQAKPKKVPMTAAEKQKAYRERKKLAKAA